MAELGSKMAKLESEMAELGSTMAELESEMAGFFEDDRF